MCLLGFDGESELRSTDISPKLGIQSDTVVGVPRSDLMGGGMVNPVFTLGQEVCRAIKRVHEW